MGWIEDLHGKIVGLDSAPLIYYVEADPLYFPLIDPFFDAVAAGAIRLVTTTITLTEVLTKPLRLGHPARAEQYRTVLLMTEGVDVLPVTSSVAEAAAHLRAAHGFRTPDAIQLATAGLAGARHFLTNDAQLQRASSIQVLVLDRLRLPPGTQR